MERVTQNERIKAISKTKLGYNTAIRYQESLAPGRRPGKLYSWDDSGNVISKGDHEYPGGISSSHPW